MSEAPFLLAHARAEGWGAAAKSCLDGLGRDTGGANIGFLYATETFSGDLGSILTFLRETTRIEHWVGGIAPGICADDQEYREGGALAVMVGTLPDAAFHVFGGDPGTWPDQHRPCFGLVHGDPRDPGLTDTLSEMAEGKGFLMGGLLSAAGPPAQLADQVVAGGLAGLLLDPQIEVLTGMSQGCHPIGPLHSVTESWEGVIMTLDGRSAIEVLKEEVGELLARDLRRIAGFIHVGLPVSGADTPDYMVRNLVGIDPSHGWIAIGGHLEIGESLMFVRRDANTARFDLRCMLADLKTRLGNRSIRAGIYVSCTGRGVHMFGEEGAEPALIHEVLGPFPLIGFFANGEINRDRLYGFTGVLALLPGEGE